MAEDKVSKVVMPTSDTDEDSEDHMEETQPSTWLRRTVQVAAVAAGAVACAVGYAAMTSARADGAASPPVVYGPELPPASTLTVRSLLEGDELADLATDNIIAMSRDYQNRSTVRDHVARDLLDISMAIREQYPEDHRRLSTLALSEEEKKSALHVLRHFGDSRMVGLTHDIVEVASEGGDDASFGRRLSDRLLPRAGEIRQLREEMFPGGKIAIDAGRLPGMETFAKWHPEIEVDLGVDRDASPTPLRRLGVLAKVAGVRAQAGTLFRSLEEKLGEKMPPAPGRLLTMAGVNFPVEKKVIRPASLEVNKPTTFIQCVERAIPDPMDVCECCATHMEQVIEMMFNFIKRDR